MAIDAIVGLVSTLFAAAPEAAVAADVGAGVAAADIGAGVAAADIGGAIALPEIAVTAAAPEIAAGVGTEAALGGGALLAGGAGLAGAELTGGVTGAADLFAGGADLTGGAIGAAAPVATEGVSAVAPTLGTALGTAGAGGVPSDVLAGTTGPLSALDTGGGPSTFDQLWQSDVSQLPPGGSADLTAQTGGDFAQSFAATTEPNFTPNPLANISTGGADPFANAPVATPGALTGTTADTISALDAGVDPTLTSAGLPEGAVGTPAAPTIPASAPAVSPETAIAGSTSPLPAGTSLTAPGGVSAGASSLLSGSTLRNAALLAPIAGLGLTLARGQPSLPPAMQQALNNLGPAQTLANQQLSEGATGQLTPGQFAQIAQYKQNAKNQLYQLFARMGRDPNSDTDYLQGLQQIDQNAITMQQQFIDSAITNGLKAQGVVDSTLQSAANLQVQQDQAFQASLTSAVQSFGLVAALSSRTA
jgi:hypothetical protein